MAKIEFQGQEVEASVVEFRIEREDWNEYQLLDGSHLRLRLVLSEVYRIHGQYDPEGTPIYVAKSGNVLAVRAPDELKAK